MIVAVTDHAAERYRQRVRGTLDARLEIIGRVSRAWADGRVGTEPPPGAAAQRGSVYVRDRGLLFVCLHDRPRSESVRGFDQWAGAEADHRDVSTRVTVGNVNAIEQDALCATDVPGRPQ